MLMTLIRTIQRVCLHNDIAVRPSNFSLPSQSEGKRLTCISAKLAGKVSQEKRKVLRNQLLKLIKVDELVRAAILLDEFAENIGDEQSTLDLTHLLGSITFGEKNWLRGVISFDEYKRDRNLQRHNLLSILQSVIPTSNRF